MPKHPTKDKNDKEIQGVHGADGGSDEDGDFVVEFEVLPVLGVDVLRGVTGLEVIGKIFWHYYQYTIAMTRRVKFSIFNFQFLIILLILVVGWGVWAMRLGDWDGRARFTVIDDRNGVMVESFDPKTTEGVKIIFPPNWLIVGSDGKGEWLAGKAGRADLVASDLGILYTAQASRMRWGDTLRWWAWKGKVKWREVDGTNWMKREQTVDGEDVWKLDETWNEAAGRMLASEAVAAEGLMVTVINTTSEAGLAAREARVIENAGMRVVATQTGEGQIQGCQVRTSKQSKSKIGVRLMIRSLGCDWQEAKLEETEVELFFGSQR